MRAGQIIWGVNAVTWALKALLETYIYVAETAAAVKTWTYPLFAEALFGAAFNLVLFGALSVLFVVLAIHVGILIQHAKSTPS